MYYCIQTSTLKLYDKKLKEHSHLAFHFDPACELALQRFRTWPPRPHLLIRPSENFCFCRQCANRFDVFVHCRWRTYSAADWRHTCVWNRRHFRLQNLRLFTESGRASPWATGLCTTATLYLQVTLILRRMTPRRSYCEKYANFWNCGFTSRRRDDTNRIRRTRLIGTGSWRLPCWIVSALSYSPWSSSEGRSSFSSFSPSIRDPYSVVPLQSCYAAALIREFIWEGWGVEWNQRSDNLRQWNFAAFNQRVFWIVSLEALIRLRASLIWALEDYRTEASWNSYNIAPVRLG